MKVISFQIKGLRCFDDTDEVPLHPRLNVFTGKNNSGKSTLMQGITCWQFSSFNFEKDARPQSQPYLGIHFADTHLGNNTFSGRNFDQGQTVRFRFDGSMIYRRLSGETQEQGHLGTTTPAVLRSDWPRNPMVIFAAKRKAVAYSESISAGTQTSFDGTFSNLYARIDLVVSPGTRAHEIYRQAVESIVGVFVTTRASPNGKQAGFYFDEDNFVTLDKMGDGIAEMVALIVELSLAKHKIFVLEEPETNLHPEGLKSLLELVRESANNNQFIIATHSNIVVRELGAAGAKVFRVYRDDYRSNSPSRVAEVEENPEARRVLLREMGYEFGDFGLHEGWLFLEEASAETISQKFLIPWFFPKLAGRLRTFSAAGADNIAPSIAEFHRLVVFIHLEPVYRERLWIRADGDERGRAAIEKIQKNFSYLANSRAETFKEDMFESYYPARFHAEKGELKKIGDKRRRNIAKLALLTKVVRWTENSPGIARAEWQESAAEPINLLREIYDVISAA